MISQTVEDRSKGNSRDFGKAVLGAVWSEQLIQNIGDTYYVCLYTFTRTIICIYYKHIMDTLNSNTTENPHQNDCQHN
jgi:hypothetical protein